MACSKTAQKRKKTKHVTLETFFKKQKVAAPAHQNETDVHNNPNNESYEATQILRNWKMTHRFLLGNDLHHFIVMNQYYINIRGYINLRFTLK